MDMHLNDLQRYRNAKAREIIRIQAIEARKKIIRTWVESECQRDQETAKADFRILEN